MFTVHLARNELLVQGYPKAKEFFLKAISCSDALGEVRKKARGARALGKIALVEHDLEGAKARLAKAKVKQLCDMDIPPELLYINSHFSSLNDTLEGWVLFQEGHLPSA